MSIFSLKIFPFSEPEVAPPDFRLEVTNDNQISCSWSAIAADIEILNGWELSGYVIKITEHSVPSLDFSSTRQYDHGSAVLTQTFGPLKEGREYKVSVAGKVEGRVGVFVERCIKTRETGSCFTRFCQLFHLIKRICLNSHFTMY